MKNLSILILGAALLSACSGNPTENYQHYLKRKGALIPSNATESFTHCHGYGCKFTPETQLTKSEWKIISAPLKKIAKTPEQERQNIKKTIAQLEEIVGEKMNTDQDIFGTFQKLGNQQLDCVDESTNTTTYLALLEKNNLLQHHKTSSPAVRIPLIHGGRWPHQTATIIETKTRQTYVVDSWFHNNGFEPEIIPLELWLNGWKPDRNHTQNTVE